MKKSILVDQHFKFGMFNFLFFSAAMLVYGQSIYQDVSSSNSCRVVSMTQYRDSSCKYELPLNAEEVSDRISEINSWINSGECANLDEQNKNGEKIRLDCLSPSSLRFRYYNFFGNDPSCSSKDRQDESISKHKFVDQQTVQDGECTQIAGGYYFKINIGPSKISSLPTTTPTGNRQLQIVVQTTAAAFPVQAVYPARSAAYPVQSAVYPVQSAAHPVHSVAYPAQSVAYPVQSAAGQYPPQAQHPSYYPNYPPVPSQPLTQQYYPSYSNWDVQGTVPKQYPETIGFDGPGGPAVDTDPRFGILTRGKQIGENQVQGGIRFARNQVNNFRQHIGLNQQQVGDVNRMNKSSKISTGAIIGIIAGGVCLLVLCAATACYLFRQTKQQDNRVIEMQNNNRGQMNTNTFDTTQNMKDHSVNVINDQSMDNNLPGDDSKYGV